jgi:hypothetical protein
MFMVEEDMDLVCARETVTATPNAKEASSVNRETDTLASVDAMAEAKKTGITVLSLLLLSKPMLEDWLIIELLLKDTELSRLPVLEPISVEDTLLLLRKELLLVPEHLEPTE